MWFSPVGSARAQRAPPPEAMQPTELEANPFGPGQPCFGCSPDHPIGFHLRFWREDDSILTRFTPGDQYQGPPGILHGGLVTTLADELGAWTVLGLLGKFGFTASLGGKILKPLRVGHEVLGRGRITKPGSRVVGVEVTLRQADEDAFRGEFTFVLLDKGGAERLLGGPIPEAWEKFCR